MFAWTSVQAIFIYRKGAVSITKLRQLFSLRLKYERQVPKNLPLGVKLNCNEKLYTTKFYPKNNFISIGVAAQHGNTHPAK